jgi:hypothetical protein
MKPGCWLTRTHFTSITSIYSNTVDPEHLVGSQCHSEYCTHSRELSVSTPVGVGTSIQPYSEGLEEEVGAVWEAENLFWVAQPIS